MEAERPSLGERDGTGSWHPAMRPDSNSVENAKIAPNLFPQEDRVTGSGNELQQPVLPAKPIAVPEKPLNFGGGHEALIEKPQQTDGSGGDWERLQGQGPETDYFNNVQSHAIDALPPDVHLPGVQLMDEDRPMDSITSEPSLQDARLDFDNDGGRQTNFMPEAAREKQVASEMTSETNKETEAREGMDNTFKFGSDQESTNSGTVLDRTNSFPAVPPLHGSTIVPAYALPKSQAEAILEHDKAFDEHEGSFNDDVLPRGVSDSLANEDRDDFFANLSSATAGPLRAPPADEEMRYEEGLPLVPTEHLQETDDLAALLNDSHSKSTHMTPVDNETTPPQSSAHALEDSSSFRPQPLDRKTTTQVLDAMHYVPHEVTHLASEINQNGELKDNQTDRPPMGDMTGGGIAASTETVESEVFADERLRPTTSRSKEDDLADLWKAALGDDDILNDDEPSLDPSVLFGDDDGFLDDLANQDEEIAKPPISPPLEAVYNADGRIEGFGKPEQPPVSGASKYVPAGTTRFQQGVHSIHQQNYPAPNPQMPRGVTALENSVPTPVGFAGAGVTAQQPYGTIAPLRPQMPESTQSFADKSKGGYTSPYDLPIDITRPKKRNYVQPNIIPDQAALNPHTRVPPPRSSSMFAGPPAPSQPQPTVPNASRPGKVPVTVNPAAPTLHSSQSTSSFFEDLAPKPRPSTSAGKHASPPSQHQAPHAPPMASSMSRQASVDGYSQQAVVHPSQPYELRQPEKMSLFGSTNLQHPPVQPVSTMNSRYSPASHQPSSVPPSRIRYASSPVGASQPPVQGLPFQPRTSSPLAQSSLPRQPAYAADASQGRPSSDGQQPHVASYPSAPQPAYSDYEEQRGAVPSAEQPRQVSPLIANSRYAPLSDSPSSGSQAINTPSTDRRSSEGPANYQSTSDLYSMQPVGGPSRMPPQRSQTQSPGTARTSQETPLNRPPFQRPASVSDKRLPSSTYTPGSTVPQRAGRVRGYSEATNYVTPTDGREMDPLERWKGSPIMTFGFGGIVVTSFPVLIPRYAAGQKTPLLKCSPGEVKIRGCKSFTLNENVATFPGPLKAKGKKKEVLEWLQNRISDLENNITPTASSSSTLPDPYRCLQEKTLLWQIVKVFVEYDGLVDGNQAAEEAVRAILSPELNPGDVVKLPTAGSSSGIVRRSGATNIPETVDQGAMEELRKALLRGDREKAIWLAVDNRMWAHAMLIATTLDPKIRKQVSSEFIKQEVKSFGENTESLSALYQIFSGNGEESIDELVPPSARAGLQMISKAGSNGPTKNALDGLDRWRETLTLIMGNRTPEDGKALMSLGQLLAGYGRTEAAHISYMFAKLPALFGGPDDPQVGVALLGADHIRQPSDYGRDMDSILLTEVYEYALTTLAASSAATVSPHLQSYKLYHAMILAEHGHKTEAQQYCDAITSALKSTTRLSPYYHPLLFGALENLTERLRQAPKDGSNSWISRPSIDKVSGSIWAKFNSYVAGDDSDAASNGSGMPHEAETGPFARVAGDTPNISRSPSVSDLYGSSGLGLAPAATPLTQPVHSRYAPVGLHTTRSSQEQSRSASQEPQGRESLRPTYTQQQYHSKPAALNGAMHEPHKPQFQPTSYAPQQDTFRSTLPTQSNHDSAVLPDQPLPRVNPFHLTLSPTSPPHPGENDKSAKDPPLSNYGPASAYQPTASYEHVPTEVSGSSGYGSQSASGYEPPVDSNYEAPAYEPPSYNPEVTETISPTREQARRRDNMDNDDDDFEARAAAMRKEERARKDREADELMRKAAEEDGKRCASCTDSSAVADLSTAKKDGDPKLNNKKSGWFSGWLGGSSKETKDSGQQQGNAPIKVKLGEESSFYYDKEKGKWINKKAGPEEQKASAPPPPPPKGPPSRAPSGAGGPPTSTIAGTPPVPPIPTVMPTPPVNPTRPIMPLDPASTYASRSGTPAIGEGGELPAAPPSGLARTASAGPPSGPPSAPPSRPTTSQGGAGGLDDLIGAPQARKGGTVRAKAKRKGYVDVMAK